MRKILTLLVLYIACAATVWGQSFANPQDMTSSITNPTFDSANGWTFEVTADGYANNFTAVNNCAEQWNRKYNFNQTLTGLPNGFYKLSVQGFYRAGNGGTTATDRHAILYANNVSTPLVNILSEAGHTAITGSVSTPTGYGNVPNDMASANGAFAAGLYNNHLYVQVTDGTLKLGIKKDNLIDNDWTAFDNFKLAYYGTTATFYLRNRQTSKFLTGGNNWGTQASLHETGLDFDVTLSDGKYTFDTKVVNENTPANHYLGSGGFVDQAAASFILTPTDGTYFALSVDGATNFLTANADTRVAFNGASPASYHAQWEFLTKQDLIDGLKEASSFHPMNATFFIAGFDFNRSDSRNTSPYWNGDPECDGYNVSDGGYKRFAQKKGSTFDVSQHLTGLPKGYYVLTAQAFYRYGTDNNNQQVNAQIYAGGQSVNVPSINDGSGNFPTNNTTAGDAFAAGRYQTAPLTVYVDDSGNLTIGVRNNTAVTDDWTAFDNFHLTYLGQSFASTFTGSGTYYLQNVATGEYLQGGSSHGTKAVLGNGRRFQVQYNGTCHTLSSGITNNGEANQYLCTEASLDHIAIPYAIQTVSEGIYVIATTAQGCNNLGSVTETLGKLLTATSSGGTVTFMSGRNTSDPYSQWRLVTEQERIDALGDASESNPMDATFLIGDAAFTSGDVRQNEWTGTYFQVERDWNTQTDGAAGIQNASSAIDVSQQLTGLPNGVYEVSMEGCHKNGNNAQFYADNASVNLPYADGEVTNIATGSAATYSNDNYKVSLRVTVSNGSLKIGVRSDVPYNTGDNLLIFDNFRLTYLGPVVVSVDNPYTGPTATYYLKNEDTGEYLQGGGFDGFQTMLGNGTEFELVKHRDGIYSIRNIGINPDGNDYLCDEGRLDHQPVKFIIAETYGGSGVYYIATQTEHCNGGAGVNGLGAANRYLAAAQSVTGLETKNLNEIGFYQWSVVEPGGTHWDTETGDYIARQWNIPASGQLVYGDSRVTPTYYADLSGYSSITVKGTEGSSLRFLFNRITPEGNDFVEKNFTIGSSGVHTIDLTGLEYVHLNAIKIPDNATANISSITVNKLPVKAADLKNIQFALWSQAAPGGTRNQLSPQNFYNHVGTTVAADGLVFGDAGVWPQSYADLTGYKYMVIKAATPGAVFRVLLNREGTNDSESAKGDYVERTVTINDSGYGILDLSDLDYVHLNAIKLQNGSASTLVESITLSRGQRAVSFEAGTNQWDSRAQWRLVTEAQRISELNGATRSNPKDATFLIKNASLTEIDNNNNLSNAGAEGSSHWKRPNDTFHWYYIQRDTAAHTDGAGGVVKSYNNSDVYQQLANLPNGLYEVSMQGCYRHFGDAVFYANDTFVPLDQAGSEFDVCMNGNHDNCTCRRVASVQTYGTNNYKKTLRVIVTDGTLRIGVKGNRNNDNQNFLIFDNFTLSYLGEVDITTYYVRNVATGDFIRAGGRYEAQAIRDDWGLAFDFYEKGEGIYAIDSRISNGGSNQFLGTNGFLDSPETDFTFVSLGGNNRYAIRTADGKYLAASDADEYVNFDRGVTDAYNDTYAQWELLTREQLINELRNSNASDNNPQDATFFILSPNFGRHDLRTNTLNWNGVSFEVSETSPYGGVESTDWNSPDNFANMCVEQWNTNFDIYQDLTGLPAGVYELTVQGFYRSGSVSDAVTKDSEGTDLLRPFVYVKQGDQLIGQHPFQSIMDANVMASNVNSGFSLQAGGEFIPNTRSDAAKTFRDGYYAVADGYNKVRFVVTSEGATIRIGVKKNMLYGDDWTAFDNFRLTYLGSPQNGETQKVYTTEIGTTLGTFYLKNVATGRYLTAGGSDGVHAALGDKMHQHSSYNDEDKYNQYTAGSLNGQLKGVRETDFTFILVQGDGYAIQTGIGDGFLIRDGGARLNGTCQIGKSLFKLQNNGGNNYCIIHSSDQERTLRYTDNSGATDVETHHSWQFSNYRVTTDAAFKADASDWNDGGDGRYTYNYATNGEALMLGGAELPETKGLLFTASAERIMVAPNQYLRLNGQNIVLTIPGLKAGQVVTIQSSSPNGEAAANRMLTPANLNVTSGFQGHEWNNWMTNTGTVQNDGDVTVTTTGGGLNIFSIQVTETVNSGGVGFQQTYYQDDYYKWIFQTREDLLNEFNDASEENPIDATFLLHGTSFHKEDSRNSDWIGAPVIGGADANYVASATGRTFDISQKLTGVPNGVYEYTLQGYYLTGDDAPQTDVRYYVSTDSRTLFINNYPGGAATFVNSKGYTAVTPSTVWEETFVDGRYQNNGNDKTAVTLSETVFTVGGQNFCNISTVNGGNNQINSNFAVAGNFIDKEGTICLLMRNDGLYSSAGGPRLIAVNNLSPGQTVRIKRDKGSENGEITAANEVLRKDLAATTDEELVFRVMKSGIATLNVPRYVYIKTISVMTEQTNQNAVSINSQHEASEVLGNVYYEQGTHPVIRFKVENGTIIAGVYNTTRRDNATLYIDDVRLTYLGENATVTTTPTTVMKGIIHKRSRFYELAEESGHVTFSDYNTVAANNTTLSDKTMVAHGVLADRLIQHTPVYEETIYAMAGQKLEIMFPSSYTNKDQSSSGYYQRIYNYQTDGLFEENAATTGLFDFNNSNHTNEVIRNAMLVYEGTYEAPAGGWLLGTHWGRQMVSTFNYTAPTTFGAPVQIGIDHGDFTDVGDMEMFGNLTEPTLSQRLVYTIQPASVMVEKLNRCTGDVFLEEKSISFPTVWYGGQDGMNPADKNAVALDMALKNYFTDAGKEPGKDDFQISIADGGTGISLVTKNFSSNTDRFIQFDYPAGGEVTNYKDKTAVITVTSGGRNIARFRLHFVPNTELRPWKDIMGQSHLRRSPVYLDEHAVLMDELNFDSRYEVTYPATWPVGDETSINGVGAWNTVSRNSWFNTYPLDFDQTSFAVYYPQARWGQYSVMNAMSSYQIHEAFKDVNQLYHDHYGVEGLTSQQHKYPGNGYFMYIDASNFPSSIATLNLEEDLCEGTTIHFSGWVSSMDPSSNADNAPGYLLFSIVGIKADGTEEVVESFCPGPIRADAMEYSSEGIGSKVLAADYNNEVWGDASSFIWQQFAFSFVIKGDVADDYRHYALKIDNYCSKTSGGDMMVDDVRLYIQKAVPDIMQNSPICSTGDLANDTGASTMEIYTTFDQLLNAVNMTETQDAQSAYESYEDKQGGGKIIPAGWYCFLDKDKYDAEVDKITDHSNTASYDAAFNAALVTTGGDNGFYRFDFSTHFASNDGGKTAYTHTFNGVTDYPTYTARGETITTEAGEERRIYLNLEDCAVSLRELEYYRNQQLNNGTSLGDITVFDEWTKVTPDWNMGKNGEVIYGTYMGEQVHYVDLEGYDELRVYQTEGDPIRCIFLNTSGEITKENVGTNLTVSSEITPDRPIKYSKVECGKNGEYYWSVDLNEVKEKVGTVKLIAVKSNASGKNATVTAINLVRKAAVLTPNKDYYIVFRAYKGETGAISEGGVSSFFHLNSAKCAAMATFALVSGTELRYDGTLSSEQTSYCTGQIATLKMELLSVSNSRSALKEEDLFYDWWMGDIESFSHVAEGKHDSPQNVLFDFRDAYYGTATTYDGQPAKEGTDSNGRTYEFSEQDRAYLEELVREGKFMLYQSSLNARVIPQPGKNDMYVTVMPIVAQLEALTGLPYCKGPLEVTIPVMGTAPTVKDGFSGVNYPMEDVPLRIGLSQLRSATDESGYVWDSENTSSLYIPLRNIAFSNDKYQKFGKKKAWDDANTLDIAAVYLAETDDPEMVSYGADVDKEGNRELRYVGKVHTFEAGVGRGKFEDYVQITFNPEFTNQVKEGYRYTLKTSFEESGDGSEVNGCHGDLLIPLYIVPEYQVWAGGEDGNWANDDNWRRADNPELKLEAGNVRLTNEQNTTARGFVPMTFTHVLMKSDSIATLQYVGKDADGLVDFTGYKQADGTVDLTDRTIPTQDIEYHLMAEVKAPAFSWFPQERTKDIYCEPFNTNTAKEVHFEPHSQMLGSRHLNYKKAWVEYALESGRWYTLSSPLKGVVSGDMYLPRGTVDGGAKQQTPYFTDIDYNSTQYTRLAPAVYQQAWDKAEATTYRLERNQLVSKLPPAWESQTARVSVARAFDWSREYNDVKVPFGLAGFSVKVDMEGVNEYVHTDGEDDVLLRLPKNDKAYRYYLTDDNTSGSQTVDLTTAEVNGKKLRENAGKLFTDDMTDDGMTVTLTNNSADNPYFLIGNPFMGGLDLDKFFSRNAGLEWKYWILTGDSYLTGVKNEGEYWLSNNGEGAGDVAPLQAFIVKKNQNLDGTLTVTFTDDMAVGLTGEALETRAATRPATLRITALRNGVESHVTIVCSESAEPGFKAGEDAEVLFDSHLADSPLLYTMAGDVAAAVNVCRSLHGLPVGTQSEDDAKVYWTFDGVEQFDEEIYLYDAESGESTFIPSSGTTLLVSGEPMGRYYLVNTPIDGSAADPAPRVSVDGEVVSVVSLSDEIESVVVHDVPGRRVHRETNAGTRTAFTLAPGVYMVTVKTANHQIVHKVQVR